MNLHTSLGEMRKRISHTVETPAYIVFKDIIIDRVKYLSSCFDISKIYYSMKSNPHPEVLNILYNSGIGIDVSSHTEFESALFAGFSPDRISVVGPWKDPALIKKIYNNNVSKVCIESLRQAKIFKNTKLSTRIYGRVHININNLNSIENMQAVDSPFGLTTSEYCLCRSMIGLELNGVHLYGKSDMLNEHDILQILRLYKESNIYSPSLSVQWGPGIGIPYDLNSTYPSLSKIIFSATHILNTVELTLEIGRFLISPAAIFITTVVDTKIRGENTIAICDGGITSFARSMLTGAVHPAIIYDQPVCDPSEGQFIKIKGPTCTPLDYILTKNYFSSIKIGSKVIILLAGAYGFNLCFDGFVGFKRAPVHIT